MPAIQQLPVDTDPTGKPLSVRLCVCVCVCTQGCAVGCVCVCVCVGVLFVLLWREEKNHYKKSDSDAAAGYFCSKCGGVSRLTDYTDRCV